VIEKNAVVTSMHSRSVELMGLEIILPFSSATPNKICCMYMVGGLPIT